MTLRTPRELPSGITELDFLLKCRGSERDLIIGFQAGDWMEHVLWTLHKLRLSRLQWLKPTSGLKRGSMPPLPSSTTRRAKLDVAEVTSLNADLNDAASLLRLGLQETSEDPRKMTLLLSTILNSLLSSLAETTAKDDFISPLVPKEAERFVEGFSLDERREWEDGIRTCMESGNWTDLITHRMYPVTLQDVILTMITAKLQKPSANLLSRHCWSNSSEVLELDALRPEIQKTLDIIRPEIEIFLRNPELPEWVPPSTAPEVSEYLQRLQIPAYQNGSPSLLFHNLSSQAANEIFDQRQNT